MKRTSYALGLTALLASGTATAQTDRGRDVDTEMGQESQGRMLRGGGYAFSVGGGVTGFTDGDMDDFADVGGSWEARLVAGTRTPIAIEGAYVGTAQNIDALGLDNDAILVGTGLEGNLRFNFNPEGQWVPYGLVGAGWKRYDLTRTDFNTSAVQDDDNVFEIPLGLGVAYRMDPVLVDLRAVFRPAVGEDLIAGQDVGLHNWSATLRAGFEF